MIEPLTPAISKHVDTYARYRVNKLSYVLKSFFRRRLKGDQIIVDYQHLVGLLAHHFIDNVLFHCNVRWFISFYTFVKCTGYV